MERRKNKRSRFLVNFLRKTASLLTGNGQLTKKKRTVFQNYSEGLMDIVCIQMRHFDSFFKDSERQNFLSTGAHCWQFSSISKSYIFDYGCRLNKEEERKELQKNYSFDNSHHHHHHNCCKREQPQHYKTVVNNC